MVNVSQNTQNLAKRLEGRQSVSSWIVCTHSADNGSSPNSYLHRWTQ